jgi:hypothetical protein
VRLSLRKWHDSFNASVDVVTTSPLGSKRDEEFAGKGVDSGRRDCYRNTFRAPPHFGWVGPKRLHLFHGTPVCSRQISILRPTVIGGRNSVNP